MVFRDECENNLFQKSDLKSVCCKKSHVLFAFHTTLRRRNELQDKGRCEALRSILYVHLLDPLALALAAYERGNVVIHRGIYQLQDPDEPQGALQYFLGLFYFN
jgi:hypothetical protein